MRIERTKEKPQGIFTAVALLWTSLAVGLIKVLIDLPHLNNTASPAFTNFVFISTFSLIGFLNLKISTGRNWARITFLAFFIIGTLPFMFILLGEFSRSAVLGTFSVAQFGLQGYALFLLFTKPVSGWFRKAAAMY